MGSSTLISVEEYLRTSFPDGDREYVDGRIVERNVGEIDHSDLHTEIAHYMKSKYKDLWAGVEVRVQVRATRFRVPDITVVAGLKPKGRIITAPPHLVIEVLSPDDRAEQLQEKIEDYLAFGIPFVWVVNPRSGRGYVYTPAGMREAKDRVLRTEDPAIELPLAAVLNSAL
jgi:Uma2 family endonuclease